MAHGVILSKWEAFKNAPFHNFFIVFETTIRVFWEQKVRKGVNEEIHSKLAF